MFQKNFLNFDRNKKFHLKNNERYDERLKGKLIGSKVNYLQFLSKKLIYLSKLLSYL